MKYIMALFILFYSVSCKPKIQELKADVATQNINRVWMLVAFANFEKQVLITSKAELNLRNPKTPLANLGCNGISADYKIVSDSKISFSNTLRTEMACTNMKLEDDFMEFLPAIEIYKIEGHKLILANSKNEKMVFIAQDWD